MLKLSIACVVVVLLFASATAQKPFVRTIHIDRPKEGEPRYYYVPFEVAPSTTRINIICTYDRAYGSNTIDLGLFDPRFTEKPGDISGFRGWSGYRRSEVSVSRESATPGYLPGEIQPGTWRIILGLYQVASAGVDVTIKIDFETGGRQKSTSPQSSTRKAKPSAKTATTRRWVRGDLHMHTVHSDGDWTIPQMIAAAVDGGLDFISITDHNTNSHHAEIEKIKSDLLIIRGEEITTYSGHANVWGLSQNDLIDFRVQPQDKAAIARVVAQAHQRGALISINHPFGVCGGCMWNYGKDAEGFDAIEVWNGSWDVGDELAVGFWDRLLQKGRRITAIASSDSHKAAEPLGQASTHVAIIGKLSESAVLNSIRAGHAFLTADPRGLITFVGQQADFNRRYLAGDVMKLRRPRRLRFNIAVAGLDAAANIFLISDGHVVKRFRILDPIPINIDVDADHSTYFRLEVFDQSGKIVGLTNPIYVEMLTAMIARYTR